MGQDFDKPEKAFTPGVAIDGSLIKNVRETKKLTQLYVASVVGVTTDTISRWENNRYPSVKRENAEKLASALEVPLEEILRQEEVNDRGVTGQPAAPLRSARLLLLSGMAALVLLSVATFLFLRQPLPKAPAAVRWAPPFAAPGEIIPVQIKVTRPLGENSGFILKEKLPGGSRLFRTQPASSAAESSGSGIKWLIPGDSASTTVYYTLQVPAAQTLSKAITLSGEIVVRAGDSNRTEPVAGSNTVRLGNYHWADANGDARIDDDEIMPAYYICEEMKGLGLDWKTIETIWSAKGYRWDRQAGFTPFHDR